MRGASFDYAAEIPLKLNIQSIEAAQKALAEHEAHNPGDYHRCVANGTVDRRRAWLLKRDLLQMDLTLAQKSYVQPATRAPKIKRLRESPGTFSPARKTVQDFLEMVKGRIKEMEKWSPRSKEWRIARASAQNYRLRLIERAEMDGVPVPELPEIPGIPDELKLSTGRKEGVVLNPNISDERRAKERERDRRRRQAAKANKAVDVPMPDVESVR